MTYEIIVAADKPSWEVDRDLKVVMDKLPTADVRQFRQSLLSKGIELNTFTFTLNGVNYKAQAK